MPLYTGALILICEVCWRSFVLPSVALTKPDISSRNSDLTEDSDLTSSKGGIAGSLLVSRGNSYSFSASTMFLEHVGQTLLFAWIALLVFGVAHEQSSWSSILLESQKSKNDYSKIKGKYKWFGTLKGFLPIAYQMTPHLSQNTYELMYSMIPIFTLLTGSINTSQKINITTPTVYTTPVHAKIPVRCDR